METPLEEVKAEILAGLLHGKFKTQYDGKTLELELIEVEDHQSPKLDLFFLHFRGPIAPRLPQKIHRLEHEKLGTFSIFFTAIAADSQSVTYEAVFNRVRK